jgi:polyribonucleotide nucleotidyltransferase
MNKKLEKMLNGQKVAFYTGDFAMQADAAVIAMVGETTVMATVVSAPAAENTDFFPLKIDYEERFYAGGYIGGNKYAKRENRPTDEAVVKGRLIDHAIRPLFPKDFMEDTQLIITVTSIDKQNDPLMVAFLAASAALSISGLPFNGPIAAIRLNKVNGLVEAKLGYEQKESSMDLVVSYLDKGRKVQAIEAHGHIVPEVEVVEAIKMGSAFAAELLSLLDEFKSLMNVSVREYKPSWINKSSIEEFKQYAWNDIQTWKNNGVKFDSDEWNKAKKELIESLKVKLEGKYDSTQISILIGELQKLLLREEVLINKKRIDGRGFDEIRPLSASVGELPRVHGSAMFTRGLTQSLTIATLGSGEDKQIIQELEGEYDKKYLHHYNFPPFSTGEIGKVGGANRRSIGHGMLAEKALTAVLPNEIDFPYTIRTVSEILSSNGSTSMAATCASSLALMDAGVPIKAHVGGIGVGLFVDNYKENPSLEDYILLTDIIGNEDFAGYMDFKLTGTREGMTAIQMELKVQGIPVELLDSIFERSRNARQKVIDVMEQAIATPRKELSQYAPKIRTLEIPLDKIGIVIGSGGSTIKEITAKTETSIDINEQETFAIVSISGFDSNNIQSAYDWVKGLTTDIKIGEIYEGTIVRIEAYGAFVNLIPNKDGLLHVSEVSNDFVKDVNQIFKLGDKVQVKVIGIENGKVSVSRKALLKPAQPAQEGSQA